MGYVTYSDLIQFMIMLAAVASFIYLLSKRK